MKRIMKTEMTDKKIRFSFAVNHSHLFEPTHFGDADKFLIFDWNGSELEQQSELINEFKSMDENQKHGSKEKGDSLIHLLQKNKIQVLVSKKFGPNIKMVNQYFIPVIMDKETIVEGLETIKQNITWIEDELSNNQKAYKLFRIKKGVLKTVINERKQ